MRLSRRLLACQPRGLETAYLAFDGVTDRGFASGAMSGIGTTYTVAQRVNRPIAAGGFGSYFEALASSGTGTACEIDDALHQTGSNVLWRGYTAAAAINYGNAANPASQAAETKVLVIKRTSGADAKTRVVRASGVEATADYATTEFRAPHSMALGYRLNADGSVSGSPAAISVLSTIVTVGEATDAQLVRYCAGEDPRAIWGSALWSYWPAAQLYYDGSNWRIPSYGTNTTSMLLTGPTSADLVAV